MGVHLRLPSFVLAVSGVDAVLVLCDLRDMGAKFTRLDLAADDTLGTLDMNEISRKTMNKCELVCSAHSGMRQGGTFGKKQHGHTQYYGSRESETFVRIYDKAEELKAKGKTEIIPHWVRVEFEYKGDRAQAVAVYIATHVKDWREAAPGWFLAYLDFKEPNGDENKSRWPTCEWWLKFLEYTSKVKLFISRGRKTVDDIRRWVAHQCTPSLYVLGQTFGYEDLFQMILDAKSRLSQRHEELIAAYVEM